MKKKWGFKLRLMIGKRYLYFKVHILRIDKKGKKERKKGVFIREGKGGGREGGVVGEKNGRGRQREGEWKEERGEG